jgi:hypothetical protein
MHLEHRVVHQLGHLPSLPLFVRAASIRITAEHLKRPDFGTDGELSMCEIPAERKHSGMHGELPATIPELREQPA